MKDISNIIKKVRKIEIRSKRLSDEIFAGAYHSIFKGHGMDFAEVRPYSYGDEVRQIDWNVSARMNQPFIKVFEEERQLNVVLMLDVSHSTEFGSTLELKSELIAELSAVLSFSANLNNDRTAAILFAGSIEKFVPLKKGRPHVLSIIHDLVSMQTESKGTNLTTALEFLINTVKKRSIVFIISDFFSPEFIRPLKIAARRHDLIALRLCDRRDIELPDIGIVNFRDAETNKELMIDTSSKQSRENFTSIRQAQLDLTTDAFKAARIDWVDIYTDKSYIPPLIEFFKKREKRLGEK